jgi:hypothetical protein
VTKHSLCEERSRVAAAELLGVLPESTPSEVRAAFLKRLEQADFQPSEQWCAGFSAFVDKAPAGGLLFGMAVTRQMQIADLRGDVEAFGREFWSMDLKSRAKRWRVLANRCGDNPALAAYLRRLAPGLDVNWLAFGDLEEKQSEIAADIKEMFTLWPSQRAARRRERLAAISDRSMLWSVAAKHLREHLPELSSLDPDFVSAVEGFWQRPIGDAAPRTRQSEWQTVSRDERLEHESRSGRDTRSADYPNERSTGRNSPALQHPRTTDDAKRRRRKWVMACFVIGIALCTNILIFGRNRATNFTEQRGPAGPTDADVDKWLEEHIKDRRIRAVLRREAGSELKKLMEKTGKSQKKHQAPP